MSPNAPYISLGQRLKFVREQARQSLAEVSGAVEIDEKLLSRIEAGQERPSEEVLFLLISHFGMPENEAVGLWELANYPSELTEHLKGAGGQKPAVMLLALDPRTQFTDGLDITVSQGGYTFTFTQSSGQGQSTPIARVGMGHEQAEAVLLALQQALLHGKHLRQQKALPPPDQNNQLN